MSEAKYSSYKNFLKNNATYTEDDLMVLHVVKRPLTLRGQGK